ncbi:hypothetical protein D7X48_11935, partial [bacterium D16-50]
EKCPGGAHPNHRQSRWSSRTAVIKYKAADIKLNLVMLKRTLSFFENVLLAYTIIQILLL